MADEHYYAAMDVAFIAWEKPHLEWLRRDMPDLTEDQERLIHGMFRSAFTSGSRFAVERATLKFSKVRQAAIAALNGD